MNDPKILDRWSRCATFMAGKCDEIGWDDDADDMRAVAEYLHRMAQSKRNELAEKAEYSQRDVVHPKKPFPDMAWLYSTRGETENGVKVWRYKWSKKPKDHATPYRRCDAPIPASVAAGALMHAMPNMSDDLWQDLDRIANEGHG